MSEVVVLPKEVAKAIEETWAAYNNITGGTKHLVLNNWNYLDNCYPKHLNTLREYCRENPIEYMRALVEGYEVEKTKEEKLLEYFEKEKEHKVLQQDLSYVAIAKTLNLLGIKIEGINT